MASSTKKITRGYHEFPQDNNLVVLLSSEEKEMPVLSEQAVKLLKTARSNAHTEGWSIFPWRVKVALMKEELLRVILRARKTDTPKEWKGEEKESYEEYTKRVEPFAWKAIEFLDYWVYDVYPFRDNRPDSY